MLIGWIYRIIQVSNTGVVSGFHTTNGIILGGLSGILESWVGGSSRMRKPGTLSSCWRPPQCNFFPKGRKTLREGNKKCQQMIILGIILVVMLPPQKKVIAVRGNLLIWRFFPGGVNYYEASRSFRCGQRWSKYIWVLRCPQKRHFKGESTVVNSQSKTFIEWEYHAWI